MKRINIFKKSLYIALLCSIGLIQSGCDILPINLSQASDGANVWIEFPRDGQIFDNEPISFVAYATDAGQVNQIQLSIDGEALPLTAMNSISSEGSNQMARLDQSWTPPANGEYVLEASNKSGAATSIHFCVVSCDGSSEALPVKTVATTGAPVVEEVVETGTFTPTFTPTVTSTATDEPTATVTKTLGPTRTNTSWPTNTKTQTEVYVPPADSSGPTINSFGTFWEGCTIYGEAYLSDPSTVVWAEFWFNHNEQGWAWILMNQAGDQWVSQVGIDTAGFSGNIEYKIRTEDSLYNESWSSVNTMNYEYCGN